MTAHRQAMDVPGWRTGLQRLFIEFAAATEAVFASAEVQRGVGWNGRNFLLGGREESTLDLVGPGGRFKALPPYPVWWSWFGPHYVPLVFDSLPEHQVVRVGDSVFHARSDEPQDRDQLAAAARSSPASREGEHHGPDGTTSTSWLPADLLAVEDRSKPCDVFPSARRTTTVPAVLLGQ